MRLLLILFLALSIDVSAQTLYSSKISKEIMDSVNHEKPKMFVDSVGYFVNPPRTMNDLVTHPHTIYEYTYTVTYKKFRLVFIVPASGGHTILRAAYGEQEIILHPEVAYAILERFTIPVKPK